jgi:hypothetical protein
MANQYTEWFTSKVNDKETFLELATLQSYIEGNLCLQDAFSKLAAPVQYRWNSSQTGRAWNMLLDLAADYEEAQDGRVTLIEALFSQPKPSKPDEEDWSEDKDHCP